MAGFWNKLRRSPQDADAGGDAGDGKYLVTGATHDAGATDDAGRVKVQFPFDREGQDEPGASTLPEPGDDVVVGFEHGDIAEPIVIGEMWNGDESPPPTGAAGGGGSNEVAMEDTAGTESMPGPPAPGVPMPYPNISKSTDTPTAGNPDQPVVIGSVPNTDTDALQPEGTDLEFLQSRASRGGSLPGLDKVEGADMDADGNDVAMETLALQHEGLEAGDDDTMEVWGFEHKVDSPRDAEAPPDGTTQTAGDLTQMPSLTLQDTTGDENLETYDYPGEYAQRFDGVDADDDSPSTLLSLEETAEDKTIIGGFKSLSGMDSETEVVEFEQDDDFDDLDLS